MNNSLLLDTYEKIHPDGIGSESSRGPLMNNKLVQHCVVALLYFAILFFYSRGKSGGDIGLIFFMSLAVILHSIIIIVIHRRESGKLGNSLLGIIIALAICFIAIQIISASRAEIKPRLYERRD